MTLLPVVTLLIFALVLLRFTRRVVQERQRQRTLTWPRTTARLPEQEDALRVSARDEHGVPIFYRAELVIPYTFYARGEKHTGNRLAPQLERLNAAEAALFLRGLARHRTFEICYNPDDPTDNYLTVGRQLLRNRQLIMYALLGVGLPVVVVLLLYGGLGNTGSLSVYLGLLFGFAFLLIVNYYTLQATPDLGALLIASPDRAALEPPADALFDSLERRPQKRAVPDKMFRS